MRIKENLCAKDLQICLRGREPFLQQNRNLTASKKGWRKGNLRQSLFGLKQNLKMYLK